MFIKFDSILGTQEGTVIEGSYMFPEKVRSLSGATFRRVSGTNYFVQD